MSRPTSIEGVEVPDPQTHSLCENSSFSRIETVTGVEIKTGNGIDKGHDVDSLQNMHENNIVNQKELGTLLAKMEPHPEAVVDAPTECLYHVSSANGVVCEVTGLETQFMQFADGVNVVKGGVCSPPKRKELKFFREEYCDVVGMAQDYVEEDLCCICLEEYTGDNPAIYGECKHHFHLPCLMNWKQRSNVCPMCSAETLRGLAEDDNPLPRLRRHDDDVLILMLQRQRGHHSNHHARHHHDSHRQRERERPRVHDVQVSGATVQVWGGGGHEHHTLRVMYNQEGVPNPRQVRVGDRDGGDAVITVVSQNVGSSSSVKVSRRGRSVRSDETNRSSVFSFFNKLFCCCKK